jgi:glycosyltransferase involved in cell wall biosynthesis
MKPLRILHVVPSFVPAWRYGGPIESVYQLCKHLAGAGCEVKVLTTDADGLDHVLDVDTTRDVEMARGLHVRYCRRVLRHSVSPSLLVRLFAYVREADLVHLHAVYSFPTLPTLLACRMLRRPVVWSPRGALQSWSGMRRGATKHAWDRLCLSLAPSETVLCVTSHSESNDSRAHLPGIATEVIANGVEIPDILRREPACGKLRLMYLGRLDPKKAISNLLEACHILTNDAVAYSLTIAGDGEEKYVSELRASSERLSLSPHTAFVGHVERKRLSELFGRTDVLVLPSHIENFGNVVPEALAHGVPVIASTGTPWSRLEEVGCGLWVSNDPQSLAAAIERIAAMPLREMGERGRSWMAAEYSWRRIAALALALYMRIAQRRYTLERVAA